MDGDLAEVRVLAAFLACAVQDDFGRVNSLRGAATDAHDRVFAPAVGKCSPSSKKVALREPRALRVSLTVETTFACRRGGTG